MEKQKPIITDRDRSLSVSIFKKSNTDEQGQTRTFYSACLQRSYKIKGSDEWKREQINLYPDELLSLSTLAVRAYNDLTAHVQAVKNNQNGRQEYPSQSFDNEPPAWVEEDIPFGNDL